MQEVVINEWADFERIVARAEPDSPLHCPYFFRGQPGDWPLLPSLARQAKKCGLTNEQSLRVEQEALKEFKLQAHLYLPGTMIAQAEDQPGWWALMQHHGV